MFLLVPAHPGFPGQIPQSRKTVVCVCVSMSGNELWLTWNRQVCSDIFVKYVIAVMV